MQVTNGKHGKRRHKECMKMYRCNKNCERYSHKHMLCTNNNVAGDRQDRNNEERNVTYSQIYKPINRRRRGIKPEVISYLY